MINETIRILLVDDYPGTRSSMAAALTTFLSEDYGIGAEIDLVASAQVALQMLEANPKAYSLVLTDTDMPEMNGLELVQEIRSDAQFNELQIIGMSSDPEYRAHYQKVGANGFVAKSSSIKPILSEIIRVMGIKQAPETPHAQLVHS